MRIAIWVSPEWRQCVKSTCTEDGMSEFKMGTIGPEQKRGWKAMVDGQEIDPGQVSIVSRRFGVLCYGMTPMGYDGWSFKQAGGGGVVIVPFVMLGDMLHIGVIDQERLLQGGKVLNLPRGFIDPGEAAAKAASREASEELGVHERNLIDLGGDPTNPNSAFFDTSEEATGDRFFGMKFTSSEIVMEEAAVRLRPDLVDPDKSHRLAESIGRSLFMPWYQAAGLSDMFTVAGVGRLLAYLAQNK